MSLAGLLLLPGQQARQPEKPNLYSADGGGFITFNPVFIPPEPEATLNDPVRKDGRIIYTLSLKDDWSCAPMSNWTPNGYEGMVTAIQLVCVKAEPKEKK